MPRYAYTDTSTDQSFLLFLESKLSWYACKLAMLLAGPSKLKFWNARAIGVLSMSHQVEETVEYVSNSEINAQIALNFASLETMAWLLTSSETMLL